MVQLSATRCSCIAILWISLVSFAAITLCVAPQRVFIFVYFFIDSVRKLLDTPRTPPPPTWTIYTSLPDVTVFIIRLGIHSENRVNLWMTELNAFIQSDSIYIRLDVVRCSGCRFSLSVELKWNDTGYAIRIRTDIIQHPTQYLNPDRTEMLFTCNNEPQ
jgi:hypothetical protein